MVGLQTLTRLTPVACRRCGRPLLDQDSIRRGIGPDCAEVERAVAAWPTDTPVMVREWNGTWKRGHVVAYQASKPTAPLRVWVGTSARNVPVADVQRIETVA